MRSLSIFLLLLISSSSFAQKTVLMEIDPDSIDPEMVRVAYIISIDDLNIQSYSNGIPSTLSLKLCNRCKIKTYKLAKSLPLLLNEKPLKADDLTAALLKKVVDEIELGIDRANGTISYLFLGGISESNTNRLLGGDSI